MQCLFPLFNVQFDTVFLVVTDFPVLVSWLCPDVGSMTLENYYGDINVSSFYWYGIYYCDEAASMLGYSDPNCETNHTLTNQVMTDATSIV